MNEATEPELTAQTFKIGTGRRVRLTDGLGLELTTNRTIPIPEPGWRDKLEVACRARSPVETANLEATNRTVTVPPRRTSKTGMDPVIGNGLKRNSARGKRMRTDLQRSCP
ncbi:MAG: hypothetical protein ACRER2_03775 [Methylococcales bacterium]